MRNIQIFICLLALFYISPAFSQASSKKSSVGISVPIIKNNSEIVYYQLGNRKTKGGTTTNYGINARYSLKIDKNLYALGGAGWFSQRFNIQRDFDYIPPDGSKPMVYTRDYTYKTVQLLLGIGYQQPITKTTSLHGRVMYNMYQSYKQIYTQDYFPDDVTVNHKFFAIGNQLSLEAEVEQKVYRNFSMGLAIIQPLVTKWKRDEMFPGRGYSGDEGKIAFNKYSIGAAFSCYYHF